MEELSGREAVSRRPGQIPGLRIAMVLIRIGAAIGAVLGFAFGWSLGNFHWGPEPPSFWEPYWLAISGMLLGLTFGASIMALAVALCCAVVLILGALWDFVLAGARLAGVLVGKLR